MSQRAFTTQTIVEDDTYFPTQTAEPQSFPTSLVTSEQHYQNGFGQEPALFQQLYTLDSSFGTYADVSPIDMTLTQGWSFPQQSYPSVSPRPQTQTQPAFPPAPPQLSMTRSMVSDEGEDNSEPNSPRDEASARRREVCHHYVRFRSSCRFVVVDPLEFYIILETLPSIPLTSTRRSFCRPQTCRTMSNNVKMKAAIWMLAS